MKAVTTGVVTTTRVTLKVGSRFFSLLIKMQSEQLSQRQQDYTSRVAHPLAVASCSSVDIDLEAWHGVTKATDPLNQEARRVERLQKALNFMETNIRLPDRSEIEDLSPILYRNGQVATRGVVIRSTLGRSESMQVPNFSSDDASVEEEGSDRPDVSSDDASVEEEGSDRPDVSSDDASFDEEGSDRQSLIAQDASNLKALASTEPTNLQLERPFKEVVEIHTSAQALTEQVAKAQEPLVEAMKALKTLLEQCPEADIQATEMPRSRFCLCCKYPQITDAQRALDRLKLVALSQRQFSDSDSLWERLLRAYSKAFQIEGDFSPSSPHWREAGFEWVGIIGLVCMLHFVTTNEKETTRIRSRCSEVSRRLVKCCSIALDNLRKGTLNAEINRTREPVAQVFCNYYAGLVNIYYQSCFEEAARDEPASFSRLLRISRDSRQVIAAA
jgi:hypothetical protein